MAKNFAEIAKDLLDAKRDTAGMGHMSLAAQTLANDMLELGALTRFDFMLDVGKVLEFKDGSILMLKEVGDLWKTNPEIFGFATNGFYAQVQDERC